MSNSRINSLIDFVQTAIYVYQLMILVYIVLTWVQLPYNRILYAVRNFLDETVRPYLALFRRFVPMVGPLDLSPAVGILSLYVVARVLDSFRPG